MGGQAALEGQEDQVSAAANTEFVEQIRDVEFDGTLSDIEFAGDFLVGKILEQRIEDFLFASAEIGDGVGLQTAPLPGKDGVDETREHGTRDPETALRDEGEGPGKLIAGFGVAENALHAKAEQRKAGGFVDGVADNDEASIGITFENIGQESAGSLPSGVRINHIDLCAGRLKAAEIRSESGLELFRDDLELRSLSKQAFEFAQNQWMRREQANCKFRRHTFRSHCTRG